jgi:ech hydrogenase subunit D
MREEQLYAGIQAAELPALAAQRLDLGWRLVVITALQNADGVEVSYVFEQGQRLQSLRLTLPLEARRLPSITGSYAAAFIYENELQDLFGVKVDGLALDFKGNFYMKARETPFIKAVASQAPMPPAPEAARG